MTEGPHFFFWFFVAIMVIPALFIVLFDNV